MVAGRPDNCSQDTTINTEMGLGNAERAVNISLTEGEP
jgi:hypothetical protein